MLPNPDGAFVGTARFRPLELLGHGTLGLVYRAHDAETGQTVALKTLRRPAAESVYLLKQEFRSLAGLVHPNLIELYELTVEDVQCFFTMELLEGVGFVEYVQAHDPSPPELNAALTQLVRGVSALHAAGKLHRDIKPSNVMVTRGGRVVLLDFGLAISLERDAAGERAELGPGTLAYAAPEQVAGGDAGTPSDWYSVGVMLYEALTGRLPFAGSAEEVLAQKRAGPLALAELESLPGELRPLVTGLLNPTPS
jgi:eukaryotic-like serine/threonine-protein kinase